MPTPAYADSARGCAVGGLSGGLTVAAHGLGGGGYPSGAALTLLVAVCAVVGILAGSLKARQPLAVFGLLGVGQLAGHYASTELVGAHHHHVSPQSGVPGWVMVTAHLCATLLCGALIVVAHQLYRALSTAVRSALNTTFRVAAPAVRKIGAPRTAQLHLDSLLIGTISRRGPPAHCA